MKEENQMVINALGQLVLINCVLSKVSGIDINRVGGFPNCATPVLVSTDKRLN